VRELRNAVERRCCCRSQRAQRIALPDAVGAARRLSRAWLPAEGINLEALERSLVVQALERQRLEPDQGGDAARPESRSDPLSASKSFELQNRRH
jgi:hypothetical protein